MENIVLNNKLECPVVGIGTFMLSPADAEVSVREALKMGYRLVDTANAYVNERAVGRGIKESGVVVIPGSKNVAHIKDNLDILDFKLTDGEMAEIAKLDKNERYYHRTDEQLVQFAGWKPGFEDALNIARAAHSRDFSHELAADRSILN